MQQQYLMYVCIDNHVLFVFQITVMYLETPGGVRVDQWNNIDMTGGRDQLFNSCCDKADGKIHDCLCSYSVGLKQFDFQLAEEPELGEYKITVERRGVQETATFKVEEYGKQDCYAPPFVEIVLPSYVHVAGSNLPC